MYTLKFSPVVPKLSFSKKIFVILDPHESLLQLCFISTPHIFLTLFLFTIFFLSSTYPSISIFNHKFQTTVNTAEAMKSKIRYKEGLIGISHKYNFFQFGGTGNHHISTFSSSCFHAEQSQLCYWLPILEVVFLSMYSILLRI